MPRGYVRWATAPEADVIVERLTSSKGAAVADGLPSHELSLPPHDEAVFFLHTAAEIEHALLVQYLYAAFSLGNADKRKADVTAGRLTQAQYDAIFGNAQNQGWRDILIRIAKEEMGHLLTVQNLLRVLGGALNFEREDFPFRVVYYPFSFTLEPLSKDSLAKYVAAERPENPDPLQYPNIPEIDFRAQRSNQTQPINRVGRLYAKLISLVESIPADRFRPETAARLQGTITEWDDPFGGLIIHVFEGTAEETRTKAIQALREIAAEGEGASGSGLVGSHFQRFYALYDQFPETNGRFGPLGWWPSLPVPRHPSAAPTALGSDDEEDGRISHPVAWRWAQLANARYRMLLAYLSLSLYVPRTDDRDDNVRENLSPGPSARCFACGIYRTT